ncbi:MAG: CPBP family intramembrane metalloprotease [Chloroflexi bacterium CFX4]|nr:CPBP family intramembrane metalloprotease [Chloroflexi bacterium CFX4]MDL1921097.1 CPBP family intramembrane metalloprotease [Chloroflexi bacterium CFX3]
MSALSSIRQTGNVPSVGETLSGRAQWVRHLRAMHGTTQLLGGAWLGAMLYLAIAGYAIFGLLLLALGVLVGALLTLILTNAPPKVGRVVMGMPRNRILMQLAVILGIIFMTSFAANSYVPLWSEAVDIFRGMGKAYFSPLLVNDPAAALGNPAAYFFIPALLLVLLGARWSELGMGGGHRVGQMMIVWGALPATLLFLVLWSGAATPLLLARSLLTSALIYGFGAEFLFRGALQTRLLRLMNSRWALATQALLFALWHVPSSTAALNGDLLAGAAFAIAHYGVLGVALGVIALRTRSLWAGTAFAILISALSLISAA